MGPTRPRAHGLPAPAHAVAGCVGYLVLVALHRRDSPPPPPGPPPPRAAAGAPAAWSCGSGAAPAQVDRRIQDVHNSYVAADGATLNARDLPPHRRGGRLGGGELGKGG